MTGSLSPTPRSSACCGPDPRSPHLCPALEQALLTRRLAPRPNPGRTPRSDPGNPSSTVPAVLRALPLLLPDLPVKPPAKPAPPPRTTIRSRLQGLTNGCPAALLLAAFGPCAMAGDGAPARTRVLDPPRPRHPGVGPATDATGPNFARTTVPRIAVAHSAGQFLPPLPFERCGAREPWPSRALTWPRRKR